MWLPTLGAIVSIGPPLPLSRGLSLVHLHFVFLFFECHSLFFVPAMSRDSNSAIVWAYPVDPVQFGAHLEAYISCKSAIQTLRLCHRYDNNAIIATLPTDLNFQKESLFSNLCNTTICLVLLLLFDNTVCCLSLHMDLSNDYLYLSQKPCNFLLCTNSDS